jgi:hypothetical protein
VLEEVKRPGRGVDNLSTFMRRLSSKPEASNSWSPLVLNRLEQRLFYLYV